MKHSIDFAETARRLRRLVENYRDEIVRDTVELVRFDTENPPGRGYLACVEHLHQQLHRLGLAAEFHLVPGEVDTDEEQARGGSPRYWLRASCPFRGDVSRRLVFHGHYDVVPAQHPDIQFEPTVNTSAIFGRGSADMKGGLVSMIYAMRMLQDLELPLSGELVLNIVPDEETGGHRGSQSLEAAGELVDTGVDRCETLGMLTAEPTGGIVWLASRGAVTMNVSVMGRGSHVGLQYRGVNAFERALPLLEDLASLKKEVESRRSDFPIEPSEAGNSIFMMGGVASTGENFNVVPDRFRFSIDRRINPEEELSREQARIFEIFEKHRRAGLEIEIDVFQTAQSAATSIDSALSRALSEAIVSATTRPARFELCPGILEIRFYAQHGVPALAYGPGLLTVSHGPKEFVRRDKLEDAAIVYALTAAKMLCDS